MGLLARGSAIDDPFGRAPQILDQHDTQRNRNGPEFTDRERLYALLGLDKPAQHLRVEAAVCMRNEGPGHAKHAGISCERSFRKFRQLAVEPARKIVADFADLLVHDMKVIDQPFCDGRDGALFTDCRRDRAIRSKQHATIVVQPFG
jgi:hypothetical protein